MSHTLFLKFSNDLWRATKRYFYLNNGNYYSNKKEEYYFMTHRKFEYFITLNEQYKEFCLLRNSRHKISAFFKRISSFSSFFLYFFSFFDPKVRWKRNWEKSRKSTRHGSVACIEIQCFLFFSLFFLVRLCRSLNSTFTNTLTCRVLWMNCMYCHERNFFMLNGFL